MCRRSVVRHSDFSYFVTSTESCPFIVGIAVLLPLYLILAPWQGLQNPGPKSQLFLFKFNALGKVACTAGAAEEKSERGASAILDGGK